jgi:crossover junction endodeoxyribonuclease RuvC
LSEFDALTRLDKIFKNLDRLIKDYKPNLLGIEELFFFKNAKTVMKISEARGVILLATKRNKIKIIELTPLQVKQYITGYGRADKKQIQQLVKNYFNLDKIPKPDDAADALAICIASICHLEKKGGE